jgi:hypothetical protein
MHSGSPAIMVLPGLDQIGGGTSGKTPELPSMKTCDICAQVCGFLHSGPKGAERAEICDACEHDLLARITKLKTDEARTREALWTAMIKNWRHERSAPAGATST